MSNTPILLTKLTLWSPVMTQQKSCFVTFRKRLSNFHVPTYVTLEHNSWNADSHLKEFSFLCTLKDSNLQFSSALMLFHVVCAIFCFGIVFDKADCANAFLTIWIACERTILPLLFWSLYFCICQSVFCSAIRNHWADNTVWLAKAFRKSTAFGTEYEPPADDKSAQIYWVFDHFWGFLREAWKTCLLIIRKWAARFGSCSIQKYVTSSLESNPSLSPLGSNNFRRKNVNLFSIFLLLGTQTNRIKYTFLLVPSQSPASRYYLI